MKLDLDEMFDGILHPWRSLALWIAWRLALISLVVVAIVALVLWVATDDGPTCVETDRFGQCVDWEEER